MSSFPRYPSSLFLYFVMSWVCLKGRGAVFVRVVYRDPTLPDRSTTRSPSSFLPLYSPTDLNTTNHVTCLVPALHFEFPFPTSASPYYNDVFDTSRAPHATVTVRRAVDLLLHFVQGTSVPTMWHLSGQRASERALCPLNHKWKVSGTQWDGVGLSSFTESVNF